MSPERFQHLLELTRKLITKKDTPMRRAITADERLAITLRFLATGDSQQSLSFSFRMGKATISKILTETSDAIYQVLKENYLSVPKTKEDWIRISKEFKKIWNMPNTIGCIDGKHIRIVCPKLTGTQYYNYKGFFSIVLMAVCDANYCFTLFDLGQYGSNNDSGVLASSMMGEMFDYDEMNLPALSKFDEFSEQELPYILLGDGIFPLEDWLMRSFLGEGATEGKKIYYYRHSRARRCIENAFGILAQRWRIFLKPIKASVKNVENYTLACLALHNYLRLTENARYTPAGFIDSEDRDGNIVPGDWRQNMSSENLALIEVPPYRGSRSKKSALDTREALKNYLNSEHGSLPWQVNYIRRTSHYAV